MKPKKIIGIILILCTIIGLYTPVIGVANDPFALKETNGHELLDGESVDYEKCPIEIVVNSKKSVTDFSVYVLGKEYKSGARSDVSISMDNDPSGYIMFTVKKDGVTLFTRGINFYRYRMATNLALTYRTVFAFIHSINGQPITKTVEDPATKKTKEVPVTTSEGLKGIIVPYDADKNGVAVKDLESVYTSRTGKKLSPGLNLLEGYLKERTYRYGDPDMEYWTSPIDGPLYKLGWSNHTLEDFTARADWNARIEVPQPPNTGKIDAKLSETHAPHEITYTVGELNPKGDVVVNLDASASICTLTTPEGTTSSGLITAYRFWACTDEKELGFDNKGVGVTTNKRTITVHNVKPESWIYCKVRVYSEKLDDAGVSPNQDQLTGTEILKIWIGKNAIPAPTPPPPVFSTYKSVPTVFSELKEGAPLAENFEAMAGVPTNKYLYFAAGGSEFIVDIELEYKQNQTASRTYTSNFTGGVACELNGSVSCPKPCGGHQVASGTDSQGHTTYKTEYHPGDDCACPHTLHSEHNLCYVGGYSDTWTQAVKFDYMKITNLKLWKIDKANLNGMSIISADGSDGVTATIAQGDPTYFCNIAQSDTSAAGRLRYSLEPQQHDRVVWNEGASDSQHSNSKTSGTVNEQAKFTERRNMTTNVTVMSDCLILQTSSGDQSIMYFQKTSNTARTTEQLTVTATQDEMWKNNPLSAAGQAYVEGSIKIGSYNGQYRNTSTKYNTGGGAQAATIFDGSLALGVNRPARPSGGLRLVKTGIDINDTIPNDDYSVGQADVFYKNVINYGPKSTEYDLTAQPDFGNVPGHIEYNAPYSPDHASINSIIIQNPVSTEFAGVISLPPWRDQRTAATPGLAGGLNGQGDVCPRDPMLCEYRTLDCHYTGSTQHTAACYKGVNVQGPNNTHVHTAACTQTVVDRYLCGITPQATYYYNYYHTDGCGSFMNSGTSPGYCSCCGSYGVAQGSPTIVWNHQHSAACGVIPAGTWSCNNLPLNAHVHGPNCGCISRLELDCTEPHHLGLHYDESGRTCYVACNNDLNHKNKTVLNPGGGTGYSVGSFINTDYKFQVYFPNKGDFRGDSSYGLGSLNMNRGKGYTDNMDTTPYTASKRVQFEFPAIYKGALYEPLSWISLDITSDSPDGSEVYDFYCPLAAYESAGAKVYFEVLANNNPDYFKDNELKANRDRDSGYQAKHSAYKLSYVDVVGRIGNLVVEDTGDFRFSNFFKMPQNTNPIEWIVPNLVKKVDETQQNNYLTYSNDIRGEAVLASTQWLNTYGLFPGLNRQSTQLPLSPEKNNIPALQKQPMRLGYDVYADIATIGNYYDNLQIIQYYYYLDLKDGAIHPVDIYMEQDGSYKPINKFGIVQQSGWNSSSITPYNYNLNWEDEKGRRNYNTSEAAATNTVCSNRTLAIRDAGGSWVDSPLSYPSGSNYSIGTAQLITLGQKARTFCGTTRTNGQDRNPGDVLSGIQYQMQAQRWHFTLGLPSSAVAVMKDKTPEQGNIDEIRKGTGVLLMAVTIKSAGTAYNLEYKHQNGNGHITLGGRPYALDKDVFSNDLPSVICVMSADKSAADDLQIAGTH